MAVTRRQLITHTLAGMSLTGPLRGPMARAAALLSSDDDLPGDEVIRKYLALRSAELEREFLPGILTSADFEAIRPSLRSELLYMLGLDPMPDRKPLNAVVTGKLERPGFTVEKLHFQSLPGLYVTANLYLPHPARGRCPAILYQCGHYNRDRRDGAKAAVDCQSHGIWFATHGYAALVVDTVELSEIAGLHRGLLRDGKWWWHSAGYTPAGVECWNAIRSLDYLATRPEIDSTKIGATGISGGGIGTFWLAAVDDRVRAAAPVSGIGDLIFYAGEQGTSRHCDCFFVYNRARWNWTNICALICPRPMLFVNSNDDVYFPLDGSERIIARLERLYALFGAGDAIDAVLSVGGHGYRSDVRRSVFEFFNRYLVGEARRVTDDDAGQRTDGSPRIELKSLRVFPEDSDLPEDSINAHIDEIFVPQARPPLPLPGQFDSWRTDLLNRLSITSFTGWPAAPPKTQVPVLGAAPREGREATQEGIEVYWRWVPGTDSRDQRWLVVLNPEDDLAKAPDWALRFVGTDPALYISTRGAGPGAWTREKFPNAAERALALVGETADSGRIWDLVVVAGRHSSGGNRWKAAGRGNAGILAAYAALYQPAIGEVLILDPPVSHRPAAAGAKYGPALLHVLRVFDVPEALGCLAPRPLTLVNAADRAFDRTSEIYRVAGAPRQLTR